MKQIAIIAALVVAFAGAALAESPLAEVKSTTEKILLLLKDSKLQGETKKEERRQVVRTEMEKRFAWEESARACLGRHWLKRTPAEKAEFVKLFSNFLKDTYSDKIDFQGEKIQDDYASVKLVLTTQEKVEHPLEYRMEKTGDDWKVYDVVIEGVSMIKNYRDQFDAIIARSSYEGLIQDIKSKQAAKP